MNKTETTSTEALKIVSDALEYCRGFAGDEPCFIGMRHCIAEASAALCVLEKRIDELENSLVAESDNNAVLAND